VEKIYSVSEFNRMVKSYIDDIDDFQEFFIEGEISNITYYKSGHLYFSIKDSKSQIKCAAFNYKLKRIPEDLKEGDLIKLFGDVGFYEVKGEFQVLVRYIEKQNALGSLYAKLEKVKEKLAELGYFDEEHKKDLPRFPKNIGVVTALTGAALQDIIKTTRKRFNSINIYIYPAKVQGIGAEQEIIKGIETLNKIEEIDFIIAGRGGGSIEDLWAFNEEEVAMAFFNSKKPIISAVGHEIDFLLSDLTADKRAATPTQAIELSVPEKENLIIKETRKDLLKNTLVLIAPNTQKDTLKSSKELKNVGKIALGEEKTVPAGKYGKQTLEKLNLWNDIQNKVVYQKDVTAVLNIVELGEVDAGIVYLTDAKKLKNGFIVEEFSQDLHDPIVYPAAIISSTKNKEQAEQFLKYLEGSASKKIFEDAGFKF